MNRRRNRYVRFTGDTMIGSITRTAGSTTGVTYLTSSSRAIKRRKRIWRARHRAARALHIIAYWIQPS